MTKKPKPGSPEHSVPDELIRQVAQVLDRKNIPYLIIGGQAVIVHGYSRWTGDPTFSILGRSSGDTGFGGDGADAESRNVRELLTRSQLLPCIFQEHEYEADFSFVPSEYIELAISRGIMVKIADYPVRFAAVEDLIIHKIIASRPQDLIDVRELLLRHAETDAAEIRRWLRQFEQVVEESLVQVFDRVASEFNT